MESQQESTPPTVPPSSVQGVQPVRVRKETPEQQRERHRAYVPKVGKKELALFRKDPHREERLGITEYVTCRECGAKAKTLVGGRRPHLPIHGLSDRDYCGPTGKWAGAPLICTSLRNDLSRRGKRQMEAVRGRPRVGLKSVRGHEGEPPAKKWPILCGLAQGQSYAEIGAANEVRRKVATIEAAAHGMGRFGRPCVYDFGEPFCAAAIQGLKNSSGLSVNQFAQQVGFRKSRLMNWLLKKQTGKRVKREVAKKFIAWRDNLLRALLATAWKPGLGEEKYSGSRILTTLVPNLRAIRELTLKGFRHCRGFLRANPSAGMNELGEWLCEQAMLEASRHPHKKFFLFFALLAAESKTFLEANLHRLKGPGNLWSLADEIIAARWSTTPHIIAGVRKRRNRPVPPGEMRRLILSVSQQAQPASERVKQNGKVGAPKGQRPLTKLRNEMAALSELLGWSQKQVAADLMPGKEVATDQMNSTFDYFSHHRAEIEDQKSRLQGISPEILNKRYTACRLELSETLSKKHNQRSSRLA